ncbi:MAG: pilus assembly protein PilP [Thermodesulfobacteriota bacterium]|nr:pilus assembly protein PilP [Thermodesulfobacteriota bacterium]
MKRISIFFIFIIYIIVAKNTVFAEKQQVIQEGDNCESGYFYNPEGKTDPFKPFILEQPEIIKTKPMTPLQDYEIGQLTLVGIIWQLQNPIALVEDSAKKGFFMRKGTLIGKHGVVKEIKRNEVVIEERYYDYSGKLTTTATSLVLYKPEEEEIR